MAYSTAAQVRAVLPKLLKDDDDLGKVEAGTYLELNNPAYSVPTILKDGTSLAVDTDYTFTRPKKIVLNTAATGEHFIAQVDRGISDTDLAVIIAQADRVINDYFSQYSSPSSNYLQDWSSWLSAAIYLRQYATATEENMLRATNLEKMAMDAMERYKENSGFDTASNHPNREYVVKVN